ncbi:MAG: SH3 domain-containing protein [Cyanobacteria bacterium P01_G01_bin.39]
MKIKSALNKLTTILIAIPSVISLNLIASIQPVLADCSIWHPHHCPDLQGGYETNKFDKKALVEKNGWKASWADDISETDAARGAVAAGVSIYSANSAPFIAWVEQLVQRTLNTLSANLEGNARKEAEKLARQIIYDAVSGKSAKEITKQFDTIDFKAGAIKYSGRNYIGNQTISRTWGIKPYVAFRVRSSNPQPGLNPNSTISPITTPKIPKRSTCKIAFAYDSNDSGVNLRTQPNGTVIKKIINFTKISSEHTGGNRWLSVSLENGSQGYMWGQLIRPSLYRVYDHNDTYANLRRSPNGTLITAVPNNTVVKFLGASNKWTHVRLPNGIEGYIYTELLDNIHC